MEAHRQARHSVMTPGAPFPQSGPAPGALAPTYTHRRSTMYSNAEIAASRANWAAVIKSATIKAE